MNLSTDWQEEPPQKNAPSSGPQVEQFSLADLLAFDAANDPDCLIGDRWLCRSMAAMIFGPAGAGKSSLRADMSISWALGRDWNGLKPIRPLSSVIVQAENVIGDEAEMIQGVIASHSLAQEEIDLLNTRLKVFRVPNVTGQDFCKALADILRENPCDLVWIDPLLSFVGDDIALQRVASKFLREYLDPVIRETGVCCIWMHHTGKPPRQKSDRAGSDPAQGFFGSVELVGYPRATAALIPQDDPGLYELRLTKRERRAGLVDEEGNWTQSIWLEQEEGRIAWRKCAAPVAGEDRRMTWAKLQKYAVVRRKLCESPTKLSQEYAEKLAAEFKVSWRTIYNWEKPFQKILEEQKKYPRKRLETL